MKKVLFSGMMCLTFIVSGFILNFSEVSAGWVGYACTTKGWKLIYINRTTGGDYYFAEGDLMDVSTLVFTSEKATVTGEVGLLISSEEEEAKCNAAVAEDDDSSTSEGDFRVTIKTYDCNGNEESTKIQGSKVKLYDKKGNKEDEDKTNSKGQANFYNIDEGKYYVKCEVDGYVNLKDRAKTYYKSGLEKVKDGKRAKETCHLIKASCNTNTSTEKVAVTGGSESFWDRLMSLVF